ncbi:MAG: cytochrome c [Deltaproteobacteria bacterium]|jgi:mono/diheme cytochrome c family protein
MRSKLFLLLLLTAACGAKTIDEQSCEQTELTYDNFGAAFLNAHCQTCHGAIGSDRRGAPLAYDFGTAELARAYKDRIYVRAASVNTTMPPGPDDPSEEAREQLAEWLACDAP